MSIRKGILFLLLLVLTGLPPFRAAAQSSLETYLKAIRRLPAESMIRTQSINAYEKRIDNPEEAIRLSLEALSLSKEAEYTEGLIFNHRMLGNLYYQMHQFEEAIDNYDQCIHYARPAMDSVLLRECYLNEGTIFFNRGLNNRALEYFLLAVDYSGNRDKEKEYNNIGAVFYNEGEYEEANNYYARALEILKAKGETYGILVAYLNIGDVFRMLEKYDVALVYYQDVLAGNDSLKIPSLSVIGLTRIGLIKSQLNEVDSAMIYFNRALRIAEEENDRLEMARSLYLIGETLFNKEKFSQAKDYLVRSLGIAEELELYSEMSGSANLLQKISERNGDYKSAYLYANLHKQASDSMLSNEAKGQVLNLMFDHKIMLQELERQKQLEQEKNERRKNYFKLYLVIFVLILIALIATMLVIRSSQRIRIDRIEKEKAELQMINVQKDLELRNYEIVGKVLTISGKNELIDSTAKQLSDFAASLSQNKRAELNNIIRDIKAKEVKNQWEEFYYYFSQVYSQFYEKLEQDFPNLTLNEKRLCAFLKLNMTTKDIAALTYLNFKSIEVARTRLRKKLNLTNSNLSFQEFFSKYN